MRLYQQKRKGSLWKAILPILVFVAAVALFAAGVGDASKGARQESMRIALGAIDRAVVTCYAIEGAYPQDFSYLEEHYGVRVDQSKYLVVYQTLGSNIRPYVELVEKGTN